MKKVLFVCKKNENYGYSTTGKRSGLYNSTRFVAQSLIVNGDINAAVVEVVDNNSIDAVVALHKPDVVIIEALWVVPEKFTVLKKLHPSVKWCVHLHSNAPFLALEGIAVQWVTGYSALGLTIISNSAAAFNALKTIVDPANLVLLPNVYSGEAFPIKMLVPGHITIGCFGAVRPMKNQFTQALAAIRFARGLGLHLTFMINSGRSETGGDPVLKNIRELFKGKSDITLCESPWYEHADFMLVLQQTVDLALQVSLSETFNIVTADAVTSGVPVVTSDEIEWVSKACHAPTDDVDAIVEVMRDVYRSARKVRANQKLLTEFSAASVKAWVAFISPPAPKRGLFSFLRGGAP